MKLESGKLYWLKYPKVIKFSSNDASVIVGRYYEWNNEGEDYGYFELFGTDNTLDVGHVEILGTVCLDVPEYAKETGYGKKLYD